jgi:molecular chaperone DnaK
LNRAKAKRPRKSGPPVATNLAEAAAATGAPPARVAAPPSVPELPLVNASTRQPAPARQPSAPPIAAQRPPTPAAAAPPQQILEISRPAPTLTFSPPPPPAGQRVSEPKVTLAERPPPGITQGLIEELDVEPDPASAPNAPPRQPEPVLELGALPSNRRAPSNAPAAPARAIRTREDAPLLIDVTPLSLRVETVAGYSDALITANTPVPCDRTKVFLTASDNQTQVFVRVAQGESNKFEENAFLGEVELSGLPPAPRGEVRIAVTFELDADGILNVRAKDEKSGRAAAATLKLLGANTDATDVAMMMARQQRHAVH